MLDQQHVSPPPAHAVKEKRLVSLSTLSNQDRELHKEAVLSAWGTCREQDPPGLVSTPTMVEQGELPIPVLPPPLDYIGLHCQTGQVMKKTLEEKKAKKGKELYKCGNVEGGGG